jgi:hypothetical protein
MSKMTSDADDRHGADRERDRRRPHPLPPLGEFTHAAAAPDADSELMNGDIRDLCPASAITSDSGVGGELGSGSELSPSSVRAQDKPVAPLGVFTAAAVVAAAAVAAADDDADVAAAGGGGDGGGGGDADADADAAPDEDSDIKNADAQDLYPSSAITSDSGVGGELGSGSELFPNTVRSQDEPLRSFPPCPA